MRHLVFVCVFAVLTLNVVCVIAQDDQEDYLPFTYPTIKRLAANLTVPPINEKCSDHDIAYYEGAIENLQSRLSLLAEAVRGPALKLVDTLSARKSLLLSLNSTVVSSSEVDAEKFCAIVSAVDTNDPLINISESLTAFYRQYGVDVNSAKSVFQTASAQGHKEVSSWMQRNLTECPPAEYPMECTGCSGVMHGDIDKYHAWEQWMVKAFYLRSRLWSQLFLPPPSLEDLLGRRFKFWVTACTKKPDRLGESLGS